MRILALDYGTKRIGVAISDEMKMIAQPLEYIPAESFAVFLERLRTLVKEKQVELILVGMPRNMDGTYGPAAVKVQDFVATLRRSLTVPIQTIDERLTTVQAERALRAGAVRGRQRRQRVDQVAAALLLQSYLDQLGG